MGMKDKKVFENEVEKQVRVNSDLILIVYKKTKEVKLMVGVDINTTIGGVLFEDFEAARELAYLILEMTTPKSELLLKRAIELVDSRSNLGWKIGLIKALRELDKLGLKEAKDVIDSMFDRGIYIYDEERNEVRLNEDG